MAATDPFGRRANPRVVIACLVAILLAAACTSASAPTSGASPSAVASVAGGSTGAGSGSGSAATPNPSSAASASASPTLQQPHSRPSAPASAPIPASITTGIRGVVRAGPTCPIEPASGDGCPERPVADAVLLVKDASGAVVAKVTSAADGTYAVALPAGTYTLEPQRVGGLLGVAVSRTITVQAGQVPEYDVAYDTGIR